MGRWQHALPPVCDDRAEQAAAGSLQQLWQFRRCRYIVSPQARISKMRSEEVIVLKLQHTLSRPKKAPLALQPPSTLLP